MKRKKKQFNYVSAMLIAIVMVFAGGGVQPLRAEAPQESKSAISGVVSDADGPVIGASVVEKGNPSNGVATDVDGKYTLQVLPNATLVVSYLGYSSQDVAVAGRTTINVMLAEDAQALEEVVVIGYGSTRKQDLSMAVSTVKLDQSMKSRPGASVGTLLQGKVPGMTIQADGGDPLKGQNITIRGKGSRDSDGVMWIVDGVPGAPYSNEDIEHVTVLKDAASAAIYGAQVGAGGVILITTKKAAAGQVKVEANVSYGVKSAWKLPQVVTAEQYMQKWKEVKDLAPTIKILGAAQDPDQYPYGTVTRTDWIDEIFRTGALQHYALSISGGSETIKTLASFSYDKNEGILLNTYAEGLNAKLTTDFQVTKWLKFSERAAFSYSNGQGDVFNGSAQGVLMSAILYPRSATVYEYDANGNICLDAEGNKRFGGLFPEVNSQGLFVGYGEINNPVAMLLRLRQNRPNATIFSTTGMEIKPIASLSVRSDFTARLNSSRYENFSPLRYERGVPGDPANERRVEAAWNTGWLWESIATYAEVFDEHHISAMAGYAVSYSTGRSNGATVFKFAKEAPHYTILSNGFPVENNNPWESIWEESMVSAMGRVGYSYGDRYFATGSIRRDATSKLHPDNNWGVFPAFSASWKLSSEEFFPQTDFINLVKLRGGWGQIGNVSTVPNYSYFAGLSNTGGDSGSLGDPRQVVNGIYLSTIPNRALTWETTQQTSFGLDITVLDNSLDLSVDYFDKLTKGLIDEKPISSVGGIPSNPKGNLGRVSNKGLEFSVGYNKKFGEVDVNFAGNVSSVKSEVLEFYDGNVYSHGDFGNSGITPLRSQQGQPWWSYQLVKTAGIFQSQAEVDAYTGVNDKGETVKIQPNAHRGDLKFVDANNDGIINDADRQFMGSYLPELTYSFGGGLEWKGIDCNIFFQGISSVKIFNGMKKLGYTGNNKGSYFLADALGSWNSTTNRNSQIPMLPLFEDPNGNYSTASDFFLEDGSYLRLKNVTVGYTLPQSLTGKVKLRVYASGENLLTFTDYSGFDPEVGGHGIDAGTYPVARAFNFGLNINF
ncbi:SusC/RagA family TonB-linked outer membrane protein [Bacteroidia bacterium]|nr:SusC/RagA family TonB-linked outer membrane protein [Bacteroidia bacterium]